ncbi:hypothetical protein G6F37_001861 [Rhizopus arrhizus]|nr:hypothetical protein G6F38_009459 [Rhizopus arrhizus]KAG1162757.1 hypothetical protein G6F37_001861 [Rhizopus arrhizus]
MNITLPNKSILIGPFIDIVSKVRELPLIFARTFEQLLTESRVPLSGLVPVYDPNDSINNWFQQYDRHCTRLGLSSEQKLRHIGPYLSTAIASWVSRSPRTQIWSQLKDVLIKTYGVPPLKHKQIVRSRLESLRQGKCRLFCQVLK